MKQETSLGHPVSGGAIPPAGGAGDNSLGQQIRRGLRWSFANMVAARGLSLASGVVLARLLAPRDYGVFAIALVATDVILSVNDVGLIAAIVRHQGDVRRAARTVFSLNLAASCVLYLLVFLAAPAFAAAVHAPDATGVVRLLTLVIIIDGVSAVPSGLLTRGLRQDLRAIGDIIGLLVTIGASILLAVLGMGAWSLAWGRLLGNATAAVVFLTFSPFRVWPGFDRSEARALLGFGLPMAGASLVAIALLNLQYVVVGNILGPVALGFYVLAFNLSSWPVSLLSQTAQRVSLAGFARLVGDPKALEAGFTRACGLLMLATIPACLMLGLLAQPLVVVLYGSRWLPSVQALQFLAVVAAVRVATNLIQDLIAAVGKSRTVLALQVAWVVLLFPALLAGTRVGGIRGAAIAQALVALGVLPLFLVAVQRAGIGVRGLAARLPSIGAATTGAAALMLLLLHLIGGELVRILLITPAALGLFALVTAWSPGTRRLLRPREQT
jgi:O-antigen/teichoic acid export membrane protein